MGLPPRPPLSAAPPPAAPHRVSTGAVAAPHARGRRPRPPGCGRDDGGCGSSGAAPPGRAFTRSPPQQVCSRRRGCGRSRRRKRRVRGRQGERPPPIAPRRGPCCRGAASAQPWQLRTGAGVSEQRAAAAPYIAGGAAPPAPSNRCRCRAGCPPACPRRRSRRRLPWPSLRHPRAARRGGSARSDPAHRPTAGPPPRPLQASGGARARPPPRRGAAPPLPARRGMPQHGRMQELLGPAVVPISSCTVPATPWGWAMPGSQGSPAGPGYTALRHVPQRRYKCRSVPELAVQEGPGRARWCGTGALPERAGTSGPPALSAASPAAVEVRGPPDHIACFTLLVIPCLLSLGFLIHFSLLYFFFLCFSGALGGARPRLSSLDVPHRLLQCSAGGDRSSGSTRLSRSRSSCQRLFSAAAGKFRTQRECELAFCWVRIIPGSVKCLCSSTTKSPEIPRQIKLRQAFSVCKHVCAHLQAHLHV